MENKIDEIMKYLSHAMATKDFNKVFEMIKMNPEIIDNCYGPNEFKDFSLILDAIFYENAEVLEKLLKNGADANKACANGFSIPLLEAIEQGWLDGVKILIHYDADINIKSLFEETPISLAEEENFYDIVDYLKSLQNFPVPPFENMSKKHDTN